MGSGNKEELTNVQRELRGRIREGRDRDGRSRPDQLQRNNASLEEVVKTVSGYQEPNSRSIGGPKWANDRFSIVEKETFPTFSNRVDQSSISASAVLHDESHTVVTVSACLPPPPSPPPPQRQAPSHPAHPLRLLSQTHTLPAYTAPAVYDLKTTKKPGEGTPQVERSGRLQVQMCLRQGIKANILDLAEICWFWPMCLWAPDEPINGLAAARLSTPGFGFG